MVDTVHLVTHHSVLVRCRRCRRRLSVGHGRVAMLQRALDGLLLHVIVVLVDFLVVQHIAQRL